MMMTIILAVAIKVALVVIVALGEFDDDNDDDNNNADMDINENDNRGSNRSLSSIDSNTGVPSTFEKVVESSSSVLESTTDTKLVKTNSDGRRPKRTKREKMAPVDIVWEQGGQNVFVTVRSPAGQR